MDEGVDDCGEESNFLTAACPDVDSEQCELSLLVQRACRLSCGLCMPLGPEPPSDFTPVASAIANTSDFANGVATIGTRRSTPLTSPSPAPSPSPSPSLGTALHKALASETPCIDAGVKASRELGSLGWGGVSVLAHRESFPASACSAVTPTQCEESALIRDACRRSCGLCAPPSARSRDRFPTSFRAKGRPTPPSPSVELSMRASGSVGDFEDVTDLERSVAALAGVKTDAIDTLIAADAQANSVLITSTISVLDLVTAGAVKTALSSALSSADAATMWLGTLIDSRPKVVLRNGESPTISAEAAAEAARTAPLNGTAVSPARLFGDEWTSAAGTEAKAAAEAKAVAGAAGAEAAEVEAAEVRAAGAAPFANDGYRLPSVTPHAAGAAPIPYPPKVPLAEGEKITVVIISDRLQPLSAAVGSILMHSSVPLQIFIIAYEAGELQETLTRTLPLKPGQSIEVLAMDAVTAQLLTYPYPYPYPSPYPYPYP